MTESNSISYRQSSTGQVDTEFTGERFIPGIGGQIEAEHVHRYLFARQFVEGRDVLDIACGEGYGSDLMSGLAKSVIGVDIDEETIARARQVHTASDLRFETGSCLAIPLEDDSVDVIVSFETIEHIAEHEAFITEARRVLRPGGLMLISTPDPDNYLQDEEDNVFHVKELRRNEFFELMNGTFNNACYGAQECISGSVLMPLDDAKRFRTPVRFELDSHELAAKEQGRFGTFSIYLVAIASDQDLPEVDWSLLDVPDYSITTFMKLKHEMSLLANSVDGMKAEYDEALGSAYRELDSLRRSLLVRIASKIGLVKKPTGDGS